MVPKKSLTTPESGKVLFLFSDPKETKEVWDEIIRKIVSPNEELVHSTFEGITGIYSFKIRNQDNDREDTYHINLNPLYGKSISEDEVIEYAKNLSVGGDHTGISLWSETKEDKPHV